jgi:hypothetical protein
LGEISGVELVSAHVSYQWFALRVEARRCPRVALPAVAASWRESWGGNLRRSMARVPIAFGPDFAFISVNPQTQCAS